MDATTVKIGSPWLERVRSFKEGKLKEEKN